jgi:hypothetical protein
MAAAIHCAGLAASGLYQEIGAGLPTTCPRIALNCIHSRFLDPKSGSPAPMFALRRADVCKSFYSGRCACCARAGRSRPSLPAPSASPASSPPPALASLPSPLVGDPRSALSCAMRRAARRRRSSCRDGDLSSRRDRLHRILLPRAWTGVCLLLRNPQCELDQPRDETERAQAKTQPFPLPTTWAPADARSRPIATMPSAPRPGHSRRRISGRRRR